ncbi:MAG: cell division protein FtsA [Bacteroidales bacterium]|nr:cell division protein FtsA [Bacteroidales bacterium]MBN2699723.1 cell division protein FtsA [Bacteroidales bacterium]
MAKKDHFVAAVDIGTTKIVSLVGRLNDNKKLEVLGISRTASKGVKRGVVLNIEETVNAIQTTTEEAIKQSGVNFKEVFVGIAGQHIKSVRSRGYINRDSYDDEITKEDIQKLINDMYKIPVDVGEEIIHVIPQSFIVDSETGVKNPIGISGKRLEANFHIVVGQISSARNIQKCINRVGLDVKQLILEPLASSAAVLTDDEKEAGVALVDIGGGTTDVAVYYDDIIRHTAVIPFGGNVITRDIKEGCSILQRQAESLKIQFGSALGDLAQEDKVVTIPGISGRDPKEISFRSLAYIIQSRMEEIIDAVSFEIENSGYMDKLSAGIVLTGGGAMLRHINQLVKFKTGLDVRIGYPNEMLAADTPEEINQPVYSTSIGLLLKGLEYCRENSEEVAVEEKQEGVFDSVEQITEQESRKNNKRMFKGAKLFENLKNTLSDIFDENDVKM